MLSKKEFNVNVTLGTNMVAPLQVNDFKIRIDNTKVGQAVSNVRLALTRIV